MSKRNLLLLTFSLFGLSFGYAVRNENPIVVGTLFLLAGICLCLILWDFWKKRKVEFLSTDQPPLPPNLVPFQKSTEKGVRTQVSTDVFGRTIILEHSPTTATTTSVITPPNAPKDFAGYIDKQIVSKPDGGKVVDPHKEP